MEIGRTSFPVGFFSRMAADDTSAAAIVQKSSYFTATIGTMYALFEKSILRAKRTVSSQILSRVIIIYGKYHQEC
ncbi:hypothetical protein ATCV1_z462L [Acanthocystis turfacea chlorella virus 1]|uniref:Uncharacterized protein z462L n=1 Tax=Chlorovirus heliozoae TaxID=322019 RepID=A7K972_9PHYC|nr:hypothetical protein ATCV1_z462L [Acanthocystis turfacea chlorella virus 1]ABT16596.1 hypothetical protein ATCV1_z462L [Acanthocystis turfacea chlorella virus 1]